METRRARNEALFREVNERIQAVNEQLAEGDQVGELRLICECGSDECADVLEATFVEYEAVRAHPKRFIVLPGHEHSETARVVERDSRFLVVEKLEGEDEVAIEHDPRS